MDELADRAFHAAQLAGASYADVVAPALRVRDVRFTGVTRF